MTTMTFTACSTTGRPRPSLHHRLLSWPVVFLAFTLLALLFPQTHSYFPSYAAGSPQELNDHFAAIAGRVVTDPICPLAGAFAQMAFPCYPRVFQPTSDETYTKVLAGQVVPAGLDIRLDMQTGERWAKLPQASLGNNSPRSARPQQPVADSIALVPGQDSGRLPDEMTSTRRLSPPVPSPEPFPRQDGADNECKDLVYYQRPRSTAAPANQTLEELMTTLAYGEQDERMGCMTPAEWDALDGLTHQADQGLAFLKRFAQDPVFARMAFRHIQWPSLDSVMFYRVIGNSLQNNHKAIKHIEATVPDLLHHLVDCVSYNTERAANLFVHAFMPRKGSMALAKSCLYALGSLLRGSNTLAVQFKDEMHGAALLRGDWDVMREIRAQCRVLKDDLSYVGCP